MVVLVVLDRESNDDRIQERRIVNRDISPAKVVSNVKLEFIGPGKHRSTGKQVLFCTTVGVRRGIGNQLALLCQRIQSNGNTSGWAARCRIKDMCG